MRVLFDLCLLILAQLALCTLVRSSGFHAISDDDFSRVVIAQGFSSHPSWDPSGSSWLPLPFLITGSAMKIFAPTLDVARYVALFLACLSASTLYMAALIVGVRRPWRISGILVAILLPYSAYLATATVPEYLSSAALVFSAAALTAREGDWPFPRFAIIRIGGALAVALASASRYEAWPVALLFFGWTTFDLWKAERGRPAIAWTLALSGAITIIFPLSWMLYGKLHHGAAFFFVKRVVDYRLALGESLPTTASLLSGYPLRLFTSEPEIMLALLFSVLSTLVLKNRLLAEYHTPQKLCRSWSLLLALLAVLVLGAARGGAPTHHSERALLSLWLLAPITLSLLLTSFRRAESMKIGLACFIGLSLGMLLRHNQFEPRQDFVDRSNELSLGRFIESEMNPSEPLALLAPDYGYFAVMAAAGQPERFAVFDKHDPRRPLDPDSGDKHLMKWIEEGGCYYIVPADYPLTRSRQLHRAGSLALRQSKNCL